MRTAAFGALYFLIVFVAGIVLGIIRVGVLTPNLGPLIAVLIELPVILAISWFVCAALLKRLPLDPSRQDALAAGALAFVLLIGAEAVLGIGLGGRTPSEFFGHMVSADGLVGLLGQVVFALFPTLQSRHQPQ